VSPDSVFRIRRPQVVADQIEDEVIAINLETGAYFSFRDSASVVWQQMLAGEARLGQIVQELSARYVAPPEEVERATRAFLNRIEAEGLIVSAERAVQDDSYRDRTAPVPTPADSPPFAVPVFEKYTDMEKLLLVDPIHEVDVAEWPGARARDP
jgi:Coenzyme PQQ synthesis protein D (PqqD)